MKAAMKREGNLMARIAERENLRQALALSLRGHQRAPYRCASEVDTWLAELGRDILAGTVAVGVHSRFVVHDPKRRVIHAPSFRERVLHHAIMNVAGPRLEHLAIADSYASRVGMGVHRARAAARVFCGQFACYLKLDVRSYFDSIDHDVLMRSLGRLFKDRALLSLLERIIRAYQTQPGRGLPIGSLVSQHCANAYLGPVDRLIKEKLRTKGYVRYMDDMVLWHDSAEVLSIWEREVEQFAEQHLHLQLKQPRLLARCQDGLPFLGTRVTPAGVFPCRRTRRRLLRKLGAIEAAHAVGRITSAELQARGQALVAALAYTRSLAWRRRKLPMRQEAVA
jgi:RNA-directed DNA polymerase